MNFTLSVGLVLTLIVLVLVLSWPNWFTRFSSWWVGLIVTGAEVKRLRLWTQALEHQIDQKDKKIEELIRQRNALYQESSTDELTGLSNKRGFNRALMRLTSQMTRGEERRSKVGISNLGIIFCDIDDLKGLNTELGHNQADGVIRQVGDIIREVFPKQIDVLSRWGGDEFAILMPAVPEALLEQKAEKLRATVADNDFDIGRPVTVTLGVAYVTEQSKVEEIVGSASKLMLLAKAAGKNRVGYL